MTLRQRIGLLAFVGGLLLLNYPFVNVVNDVNFTFGIPNVFLYVFGIWLLIIVVAFVVSDEHTA